MSSFLPDIPKRLSDAEIVEKAWIKREIDGWMITPQLAHLDVADCIATIAQSDAAAFVHWPDYSIGFVHLPPEEANRAQALIESYKKARDYMEYVFQVFDYALKRPPLN